MLDELDIQNFAIIDHLRVRFGPALTVLTGETGAGKSIIIDALGVLLGGRAGAEMIREAATSARIEGIFTLPEDGSLTALIEEYGIATDEGVLILARELQRGGRGSSRVNGRAVPLAVLQALGGRLVDVHGQTEHLALLRAADQLDILDRYAGLGEERDRMATLVRRLRTIRTELERLLAGEREAAHRLDLLRFQVDEIDRAALTPGEDEALEAELRVLASAERLRELAAQLYGTLSGGDADAPAVEGALGAAARLADDLARIDASQEDMAGRLQAMLGDVQDLARAVRHYADAIEDDPERLAVVQERLELLRTLKRKYGASIEEILAYREQAAADATELAHSDERRVALEVEEREVAVQAGALAAELSQRRQEAARRLAEHVQQELASLNMRGARFAVDLRRRPDPNGLTLTPAPLPMGEGRQVPTVQGPNPLSPGERGWGEGPSMPVAFDLTGVDQVEFLVAPNVGESPKPVAKIASGGETSRIMLALKSALSAADPTGTLIFDEVDVGVGGRGGRVIGEKLRALAAHHQVICITHLPQVAAYGDGHLKITKLVRSGRTETVVQPIDASDRLEELAQMLGGLPVTPSTRRAAQDLMAQASDWKQQELAHA